jgi:hypothetical protein
LLNNCVEGAALWALNPEEMPLAAGAFHLAINAHDIDQPVQLRWHRVISNLSPPRFPCSSHALLRDDGLLA